jgi:hypothetical protein
MYSGRKSWPHCETQCASSIANSEMCEASNRSRQRWRHQALGRHVDEVDFPGAHQAFDAQGFFEGLGRVQEGRAHADFFEGVDLVLHQRDQRRDDHADAVAQQRGIW